MKTDIKLALWLLGQQKTKMDNLLNALQEHPDDDRTQFRLAEEQYLKTCNHARMLLDTIEHETVRMGLQLRYVNRISWTEAAALLGDENVEARCMEFLKGVK